MLLDARVALVTGGSRGIGRAIAERFAREGASIVLTARSDAIDDVAAGIREAGGNVIVVKGDIADAMVVKQCIQACRGTYGRLDVLVNNAGSMPLALLGMIGVEEARSLFDLNVVSAINLTQFAARMMKAGSSIINISSIARHGIAGASVYSATKGALASFTLAASKELGPRGIRVNAIAPGFIDTALTHGTSADVRQRTIASIQLGRVGSVDDVAGAAVFLASDLSAYVTGQILGVDGGMTV
jgi:3-oxoacyl-[acyl-carrier protein] reductase